MSASRISRISIGRVYNLGNYEHVRYELTVDVPEGESAAAAVIGMERIVEGLRPDRSSPSAADLERSQFAIDEAKKMSAAAFERQHGNPVGGPDAYIARMQESLDKANADRAASQARQRRARRLFDDLAGAETFKDAKLSWDDDYDDRD